MDQEAVGEQKERHALRVPSGFIRLPLDYEPVRLYCGETEYHWEDLERWQSGDLTGCDTSPREVIASLSALALNVLRRQTDVPLSQEEYQRRNPYDTYGVAAGFTVKVQLPEEEG